MKYSFFLFIIIFFSACQIPNPQITSGDSAYFDMKSFIENEMQKLEGKTLNKKITLNGEEEEITVEKPNWKTELSEFQSADITKPSYKDKYAIESKGYIKRYVAKEDNLPIQLLEIQELPSGSTSILVEKKNENILNNSNKKLTYNTSGNYSIQAFRHSLGSEPDTIIVEGNF